MEEELGDEPDSPPPSREVVVEGEAGSFTISFMDAQTNISTGGFAYVYSGHDERNRKYALKRQKGSLADPDYADFERVRLNLQKDSGRASNPTYLPISANSQGEGPLDVIQAQEYPAALGDL